MDPCGVFFILLCSCYSAVAKKSYRIGVFSDETRPFPISWDVINGSISSDIAIYFPDIITIKEEESLGEMTSFCRSLSQEEPLLAIFSKIEKSATLTSISSYFKIPYISISQKNKIPDQSTVFNLYPDAQLLSRGLAKIVQSMSWDGFIIFYENEDSLLRLQDVMQLQQFNHDMKEKEDVMILKLDSDWDNRHLFKSIKNVTIRRLILDCDEDRVMDILSQAKETKILSDISTSVLITSLNAHTLDLKSLNVFANITTVRLFNPNDKNIKDNNRHHFPGVPPDKISVETALFHDALSLFASAVNLLTPDDLETLSTVNFDCDSPESPEENSILADKLRQVILTDSLTGEIQLKTGIRDKFKLEVIEIDNPEKPIGIWYSEMPEKVYLTRNATEREAELQKRLSSHNFIVTSRIGPPYLFENEDTNAVGNARYYGYSMDLITEIAKLMNITFKFRIAEGNRYPNLVNDLIERQQFCRHELLYFYHKGMRNIVALCYWRIQTLVRHLVAKARADLGICDFTITPQRQEIIDFSMPFMSLGIGILHKKSNQTEQNNMYGFMAPYSWSVWLYVWSLNLVVSLVMFFVARLAPNEWENPKPWDPNPEELENVWDFKNFLWLTLGSITTQGCDILPKAVSTRVISAAWWFFSLIITSSYTANLAAFLTAKNKEVIIDNVEELAAQSNVKYGLVDGGSTSTFFANTNNSLYQKMWNTMKNEKPKVFEPENSEGVQRVLKTKDSLYAFFMESTGIEYELAGNCQLRKIGNLLDSKSYGIGMPMNADYRDQINSAVLNLQESGKLAELKEKWWKLMRKEEPCPADEPETIALTLGNVGGIFVVLGIGIVLAYLMAIMEFLWNVRRISVVEKIPYTQALIFEMKFAINVFNKKKRAYSIPSEKSSMKSIASGHESEEKLLDMRKASHLSMPTIVTTNNDVRESLRKRSGVSTTTQ